MVCKFVVFIILNLILNSKREERWPDLLQRGPHLGGFELLLVDSPVVASVQPDRKHCHCHNVMDSLLSLHVEGLVVFKILAQSLQEESELPELDEVRTVFTGSFGHIFYVVETSVDGGDGIKQFIHCDDVTDSLKLSASNHKGRNFTLVTSARDRNPFPLTSNCSHKLFLFP